MNEETPPKKLLPEGWRKFLIKSGIETTSKSGNEMIEFVFVDDKTKYEEKVYAVSVPKKRWFLKRILEACGCAGGQDGVYEWEMSYVVDKYVMGLVEHSENKYIDRSGVERTGTQSKITDVREITQEDEKSWVE